MALKFRAFIDAETERINGINQLTEGQRVIFEDKPAWDKTRVSPSNYRNISERDYCTK